MLKLGGVSGEAQRRPRIAADAESCVGENGTRGTRPQPHPKEGGGGTRGGGCVVEQSVGQCGILCPGEDH